MAHKVPPYLFEKKNTIKFLTFVVAFILIFINIFKPFSSSNWTILTTDQYVFYTTIIAVIGFTIISISRLIMYLLRKKIVFYYWNYIIWLIIEIAVISVGCTIFAWNLEGREHRDFFDLFPIALFYILVTLFIPYSISWLYFALKERDDRDNKNANDIAYESEPSRSKLDLINFKDDKNKLKLSIKSDNLLYIEAADNYINIHYENKGKISNFILRSSLKTLEEEYKNSNLARCHRSFMVNLSKIKVLRKEKDGLYMELDSENVPNIPISKTYSESIIHLFTQFSNN